MILDFGGMLFSWPKWGNLAIFFFFFFFFFQEKVSTFSSSQNHSFKFFWLVLVFMRILILFKARWDIFGSKNAIQKFGKICLLDYSQILCDDFMHLKEGEIGFVLSSGQL